MDEVKENAKNDFIDIIKISWTYEKLTDYEKQLFHKIINENIINEALKGNYKARYKTMQAIYHTFILSLGYNGFNWRENKEKTF
jgi:glycine cleavage system protein P-like pyridoxal-binding family